MNNNNAKEAIKDLLWDLATNKNKQQQIELARDLSDTLTDLLEMLANKVQDDQVKQYLTNANMGAGFCSEQLDRLCQCIEWGEIDGK